MVSCPSRYMTKGVFPALNRCLTTNLESISTVFSGQCSMKLAESILSNEGKALSSREMLTARSSGHYWHLAARRNHTTHATLEQRSSFHKRVLPDNLVSLSSPQGKVLFREALLAGDMECYFPLSEQFLTQSEPAFCALSSLAMVLNALNHDPGKIWKGVWRWTSEETLRCESENVCGHTMDKFKKTGMNFGEFEGLAACHGVNMLSYRVGAKGEVGTEDHDKLCGNHSPHECHHPSSQQKFREYLETSSRSDAADTFIIANFDRKLLGQTGSGHFSPIGGYHKKKDLVLIMDVARFKYPPWWVSVERLWEAMSISDEEAAESRGYFVCRK